MQFYLPGEPRPVRESTGCEEWDEALVVLQRRVGEIAGVPFNLHAETCKISDLLEMVLDDYRTNGRASYADIKQKIEAYLKPHFGRLKPNALSSGHIKAYMNKRQNAGVRNASINRELAPLRRALVLGESHTPRLVHSRLKWRSLKEDNVREGILPEAKYQLLRDTLPTHLRLAFVIAYHCGVRRGELLAIPRERVDLANNRIYLEAKTTKNRAPRFLPVYGEMRAYLEMQLAELESKYPACRWLIHFRGRRMERFDKAWGAATEAAGLPDLLFHDLRRTALTNMENAGVPRSVATSISGHKTEAVCRRYVIRRAEAIDRAAEQMEAYLSDRLKPGAKAVVN
jgi:integrase